MEYEVSKYGNINKIINEYFDVNPAINSKLKIIEYYPRTLVLLIASTYESKIKEKINAFVYHPIYSEEDLIEYARSYPKKNENAKKLIRKNKLYEKAYERLKAQSDGSTHGDATPFYDLWGGDPFKDKIKKKFETIRDDNKAKIDEIVKRLEETLNVIEEAAPLYEKFSTLADCLNIDFKEAERSFLRMKRNRNKIAHNFLTENFSETFEWVVELYYKSMYYATALEDVFTEMTEEEHQKP